MKHFVDVYLLYISLIYLSLSPYLKEMHQRRALPNVDKKAELQIPTKATCDLH